MSLIDNISMKLKTTKDVGSLVRQTRKDRGWTQIQLAERVGVSRDWVIRLEHGRATIELGLVLRTLKALGLSLEVGQRTESQGTEMDLEEILSPERGAM